MGPHTFRVWKEKAAERAGGTIFLQFNISSRLRRPLSTGFVFVPRFISNGNRRRRLFLQPVY